MPKLHQLGALLGRQAVSVTAIDRSLLDPVPQTTRADPKILRDLIQRLRMLTSKLDRANTELRRVWPRHNDSSPEARIASRQESGQPGQPHLTDRHYGVPTVKGRLLRTGVAAAVIRSGTLDEPPDSWPDLLWSVVRMCLEHRRETVR
jgi:hypothetical protein